MVTIESVQSNADRLMKPQECADYLGYALQTVYNKVNRDEIPFVRLGRTLRFRKSEIDRWIIEQTAAAEEGRAA